MNFAAAPRSFSRPQLRVPDGARWLEMSLRAGLQGLHTPVHRLGCDMARTAASLLDAFARLETWWPRFAELWRWVGTQILVDRIAAQNEALRRENWRLNEPVRAFAEKLSEVLR